MSDFKDRLSAVRFNPALMIDVTLNELEAQLEGQGEYDVPDAGNPFVFLLEAGVLGVSMGISESEALLRRLYPSMAQNTDELYLHMSDDDYIGRFATPAWTTFELYLSKTELLQRALPVGNQGVRQLVIPRLTSFSVADTTFTMQYPIALRIMGHGGIQVVYETDAISPIQTLDSNMVDWTMVRLDGDELLVLRIPVGQFQVTTFTETLNSAAGFDTSYGFEDQFYHARVYLSVPSGGWQEIRTTHTDQVYDYNTLTAVLQVTNNLLNVKVPLIYFSMGDMVGEIRVDIYTTKGRLEMDPGSYQSGQFSYELVSIDDDLTYVSPLQNFNRLSVLNPNHVAGGSNAIDFMDLRQRVIDNTLGVSQIPITHAQLETELNTRGYTVVTNIDNITNRQFLASRRLTPPLDGSTTGGMGCTMGQIQSTVETLTASQHVVDNGARVTLLPSMLYEHTAGVIRPVMDAEIGLLQNMLPDTLTRTVNNRRFMYTPLHYVLDTTRDAFDVRPYYLNAPTVIRKLFVDENNTAQFQASVDAYQIQRIPDGYRFTLRLKTGDALKGLDDEHVIVQMGYRPVGENSYASLNGVLVGMEDGERVYQFDLLTRYDIDHQDGLYTRNWSMFDENQWNFACQLEDDFDISFIVGNHISLGYQAGEMDGLVQHHLLPTQFMVLGRERLRVRLGSVMTKLWRRNRSLITEASYLRYAHHVPAVYEETVYARDSNGQIIISIGPNDELIYEVLHAAGDPILDENGEPVYRHLAGDPILDENGEPELIEGRKILREFTLFMMDGVYYFVTDPQALTYRQSVPAQIVRWIDDDLGLIERRLLEQSELYFYPTATIGDTTAIVKEALRSTIALDQSFTVSYYLSDTAYSNLSLREALMQSTREIVNDMLGRNTVSVSDIIARLKANAGDDVISLEAGGLGGVNDFSVISILDNAVRMSLRKRLLVLPNQLLAVQDDIDINFLRHSLNS